MTPKSLSLCMIVKNEERVLSRCLDSVKALDPEIITVDTGSTDTTPAIAARFSATVIPFDFTVVDFAAARNQALARATGSWILVLDADEALHSASVPLLAQLIQKKENAGYFLERLNHRPNEETTTDYVVRLFPNRPEYRYRGRVHETIDASILAAKGRLIPSEIRIDHDFSSDPETRCRRNLWYIDILKEEIAADPTDHSRLEFLAAEYHQLGMFDKATEVAEQIVKLRPLDAQAHLHAGVYHLRFLSNPQRARACFIEALRLRPGYVEAQVFLQSTEAELANRATSTRAGT